ncbi:hypothetical protein HK097_011009 [Rhizophlyctis rosea]|uniref:SUI1 domain-containing protein n=1 Tax=Rhizophlyctis rosea TaxID=64517 RepID=A0AAD5SIF1_9FUNG|nr:hypothetical protein HK097_011009 [Rhizophlyctis rosea]
MEAPIQVFTEQEEPTDGSKESLKLLMEAVTLSNPKPSDGRSEHEDAPGVTADKLPEDEDAEDAAISPAAMDDVLQDSFLTALKGNAFQDPKALPMPSTVLYSSHILAVDNSVDVKKSTYKKITKFLKAMEKKGVIKLKERGGDVLLMSISAQHPMVQNHQVSRKSAGPKKPTEPAKDPTSGGLTGSAPKGTEKLTMTELYKGTSSINRVFNEIGLSEESLFTHVELRNAVNEYAKVKDLTDKANPRMVKIDALLCDAVLDKAEYNAIDFLPRDQIVQRLLKKMQEYHEIKMPGNDPVVRKGRMKPIQILIEQRQGRKTVTKMTNMEQFGVDVEELSSQLKVRCASSTTVTPLPTKANTPTLHEILVQGSKVKEVFELLAGSYGIPFSGTGPNATSKFVEVVDKTKKK